MTMTKEQVQKHQRLNTDFKYFARYAPLKILPKSGKACPLVLNRAQEYAHAVAEKMLSEVGKVRILCVKARQQGISTYIEGRFYQKTSRVAGTNAFIMTHLDDATNNVFKMVKRYHENIHPTMRPPTKHSNESELVFEGLDSRYAVATAGSAAAGRSLTNRLFHGSEVAFWKNTKEIRTGALQTVPDLPGTEVWLESTANGIGDMFHQMAMKALKGEGEYRLVFIPWFWMPEYSKQTPEDFALTEEERVLKDLHDLSNEQIYWRRQKITELEDIDSFKREYPATVHEAFEVSGGGLFKPTDILRARKNKVPDKNAPLIMGVDGARDGDRTVIAFRRGRSIPKYYVWDPKKGESMDEMRLAGIIARYLDNAGVGVKSIFVDHVFVDVASGNGTVDRLHELGFEDIVTAVSFGSGADQDDVYANKRAEMYGDFRDWLEGNVDIPDDDELHRDMSAIPKFKRNSSNRKILPPKEKIIEDVGFSPDIIDACVLTFAYPVKKRVPHEIARQHSAPRSPTVKSMKRYRKAG